MSDQASRSKEGKLRLNILPILGLEEVMKVAEFGAKKHGELGYKQGFPISYFINACFRHVFLEYLIKGQDKDAESGLHPLAHGAWNLLAALEQTIRKPALDDRHKLEYVLEEKEQEEPVSKCSASNCPCQTRTSQISPKVDASLNPLILDYASYVYHNSLDPNRKSGAV